MPKLFIKYKPTETILKRIWTDEQKIKGKDILFNFKDNDKIYEFMISEPELKYYCLKLKEKEAV